MSRRHAIIMLCAIFVSFMLWVAPWTITTPLWCLWVCISEALTFVIVIIGMTVLGLVYGFYLYTSAFVVATIIAVFYKERDWRWQLDRGALVASLVCVAFVATWTVIQVPAHYYMSRWALHDVRQQFYRNSGGDYMHCTADWKALDDRGRVLSSHGYTMYGWWEVSGDVLIDESGKPDSCNIRTDALYIFTWWPGKENPRHFGGAW